MNNLRADALEIARKSVEAVMPEQAVIRALENYTMAQEVLVIAIGKAAWRMAAAAVAVLGNRISSGLVVTKYQHVRGPLEGFEIIEAGHPVPDENSVAGAEKALEMVRRAKSGQEILLLVSGGGSSLFEKPMPGVTLEDIARATGQLLASGASIVEMNIVRKHLSAVKGGRFGAACSGHPLLAVVLSDVLGDRLDAIASGPAYPDTSTSQDALFIAEKYGLDLTPALIEAMSQETPDQLSNVRTVITGSVTALCQAASEAAAQAGYEPQILATTLDCEAREAGAMMGAVARQWAGRGNKAFIWGGETVVRLRGAGKGGRNQELALAAALSIQGTEDAVILSVGSDGTDGPTDAAGGMADGMSAERIRQADLQPELLLDDNDAYRALSASGDLIITGPTGTNVNDLMIILCRQRR